MLMVRSSGLLIPIPATVEVKGKEAVEAFIEEKLTLARKLEVTPPVAEPDEEE